MSLQIDNIRGRAEAWGLRAPCGREGITTAERISNEYAAGHPVGGLDGSML